MAGLAFVGQMGAQRPAAFDVLCFFVICLTSVLFCSGFISCLIVILSKSCNVYFSISARSLFRGACFLSVALGITWLVLNACGSLHVIDYTQPIEEKLHGMAGKPRLQDMSAMGMGMR